MLHGIYTNIANLSENNFAKDACFKLSKEAFRIHPMTEIAGKLQVRRFRRAFIPAEELSHFRGLWARTAIYICHLELRAGFTRCERVHRG